jgi:hypothetical protein
MQPAVVFPFPDSDAAMFAHLDRVLPDLKSLFTQAYVGMKPASYARQPAQVGALAGDDFFTLFPAPPGLALGDEFLHLYRQAAAAAPGQVLHLCFVDRLTFALQTHHRSRFVEDVMATQGQDTPLIFSRSAAAWASHPRNYYVIEQFATTAGELLFGKRLDFAWCHLAICASRLGEVVKQVRNHDLSMLAEIALAVRQEASMRDVDWLEWEDPFHLHRAAHELKSERERSTAETQKRLAYVLPMLQTLLGYSQA